MATLLVRHKVKDFAKWKASYDDFASYRKKSGIKGAQVWRNADDPHEVVITHVWDTMSAARKFAKSDELAEAMKKAGVSDKPDIYFLDEVESTRS